jgi:hypothetical protein
MEYRGPILLVFGATLVLSPIAVRMTLDEQQTTAARLIMTETGANKTCGATNVLNLGEDTGCRQNNRESSARRVMTGGVTLLSAGN